MVAAARDKPPRAAWYPIGTPYRSEDEKKRFAGKYKTFRQVNWDDDRKRVSKIHREYVEEVLG
eukprot:COSAG02_NODE_681_length_18539_cov_44.668925_9_plen_63_part_00